MSIILDKLKEPSTWKGLLLLATICGVSIKPELQEAIIAAGTAIIGVIWVMQNESRADKRTADNVGERPAGDVPVPTGDQNIDNP